MTVDTATLRAQWEAIREQQGPEAFGMIAHVGDGIALLDALEAERERVRVLQNYLWRIRDAVMHEGGWCYDYETAEGQRIAEAVHVIWREARDAGLHPFATAKGETP